MTEDFYRAINRAFDLNEMNPRETAPLILAYLGDTVYEVIVRTIESSKGNRQTGKLNRDSIKYVNAGSQARMIEALLPFLSEEEEGYYRRGKNAHTATTAKNASKSDYHKATGFEALIGYLYISGQTDRMFELIKQGMALLKEKQTKKPD